MRRILTALILLPAAWLLVKRAPAPLFLAVAAFAVAWATWEALRLMDLAGYRTFRIPGLAVSVAAALSLASPESATGAPLILAAGVVCCAVWGVTAGREPSGLVLGAAATLLVMVWVGLGLGFMVALWASPGEDGEDLLMLLLVCLASADTAAYYGGRAFGRRPLAPRLSPKKTWEGLAAGVAASVAAAWLAQAWFYQRLPLADAWVIGTGLALLGALGDLAESAVKRAAGVKDASAVLPGHGGLLDRVDGLIFAAPGLYGYYVWILRSGVAGP